MKKTTSPFVRGAVALIRRYYAHGVAQNGAALTYYLVFAIFPLLIFLSNLVGIFAVDVKGFLEEMHGIIPADVLALTAQYLDYVSADSNHTLLTFSLIFTIYFPMRAANSLLLSVRKAYGMEEPPTNFIVYQLRVLLFTVCLILTIPLSILLVTVGNRVLNWLSAFLPVSDGLIRLWSSLRFVLLGVIAFAALSVLYALAQDRRRFHFIWPGVFIALTGWMVISLFFSLYVENAARYSVIYGSIGTIVVLLMWLYMTASMLIMGAEFNGMLLELQENDGGRAS